MKAAPLVAVLIVSVAAQTGRGSDGLCTVPPYVSLLPPDIPQGDISSVQLMGRCFLACLESHNDTNDRVQLQSAAVWPFAVVKVSCSKHKFIHECTRGCSTWGNYSHLQRTTTAAVAMCSTDCENMCRAECGGGTRCSNPDPVDLWLSRVDCRIKCDDDQCLAGCTVAQTFIDSPNPPLGIIVMGSGDGPLDPNDTPVAPIAPPSLTLVTPSSRAGVYQINLEGTAPEGVLVPDNYPPVAFLFKVKDRMTEEVFYIWQNDPRELLQLSRYACHNILLPCFQNDPRELLQLSRYACHNILLSFAVVNKVGRSTFSPSANLTVSGDTSRIPNPAWNLTMSYVEDTRVGFFANFILNISWLSPLDDRYLDDFSLFIWGKDPAITPGNVTRMLPPSDDGMNSVVVMSEVGSLQFLMTQTYFVVVTSLGEDGVTPSDQAILRSTQRITSRFTNFTCQRVWDGRTYFSFRLQWTIPMHWARRNVAERFRLFVSSGTPTSINSYFGSVYFPLQDDDVSYTEVMNRMKNGGADSFFRPLRPDGSVFHFELYMDWENSVPAHPSTRISCSVDATSPPPSIVRNINITSYEVLGVAMIELVLSWEPPETANGVIGGYVICVTPEPIEVHENPDMSGGVVCVSVQSSLTFKRHTWRNIFTGDCLYVQMRAINSFVYGNWTEPILIPLDSCDLTETNDTTNATDDTTTIDMIPSHQTAGTAGITTTGTSLGSSAASATTAAAAVSVAVILASALPL